MLPIDRQNQIKKLIKKKQTLKISELSEMLDVSEMTIHRDLRPLIESGDVIKTFGGVTIAQKHKSSANPEECTVCQRSINERMAYRLILPNNQVETACCAHCGLLRHRQLNEQVVQALCYDFLKQTTISAPLAWFVMDTSLHLGCCQPQVLPFEWRDHAEKFVHGFGGNVYPFHEALEIVFKKMNEGNVNPCQHH
ncbi:DeoR family transcriptional regulator [Virgibacillus alimentarius]|uniref:DNA-binding Lrp family transcriptional regulator n=1 Tax=Virgibacillus alimentarius TaxID=698769 RepID=A0ABS4S5U8_9BACI|nr:MULTISPECIES: DeoR family transcriptional regulator [Virgibacillus]MBP2256855.1 DNA-binding Lrp family transcriptional regulator [Virgibacillus alimentarius]HLR69537.1 DeoR family transcriptional regulator [Virgibacillus sp.]